MCHSIMSLRWPWLLITVLAVICLVADDSVAEVRVHRIIEGNSSGLVTAKHQSGLIVAPLGNANVLLIARNGSFDKDGLGPNLISIDINKKRFQEWRVPKGVRIFQSLKTNSKGDVCAIGTMNVGALPDSNLASHSIFCRRKGSEEWMEILKPGSRSLPIGSLTFVGDEFLAFSRYGSSAGLGPDQVCMVPYLSGAGEQCTALSNGVVAPAKMAALDSHYILGANYFGGLILYNLQHHRIVNVVPGDPGQLWSLLEQDGKAYGAVSSLGNRLRWNMGSWLADDVDASQNIGPFQVLAVFKSKTLLVKSKKYDHCVTITKKNGIDPVDFDCRDLEDGNFVAIGDRIFAVKINEVGKVFVYEVVESEK